MLPLCMFKEIDEFLSKLVITSRILNNGSSYVLRVDLA